MIGGMKDAYITGCNVIESIALSRCWCFDGHDSLFRNVGVEEDFGTNQRVLVKKCWRHILCLQNGKDGQRVAQASTERRKCY